MSRPGIHNRYFPVFLVHKLGQFSLGGIFVIRAIVATFSLAVIGGRTQGCQEACVLGPSWLDSSRFEAAPVRLGRPSRKIKCLRRKMQIKAHKPPLPVGGGVAGIRLVTQPGTRTLPLWLAISLSTFGALIACLAGVEMSLRRFPETTSLPCRKKGVDGFTGG